MRDPSSILADVSAVTGVPIASILGHGRKARVAQARHLAAWAMRRVTDMTLDEIAQLLGGRHHTTVMFALRKVDGHIRAGDEATLSALALLGIAVPQRPAMESVGACAPR